MLTNSEQFSWEETVFSHDDKVSKESGGSLDHTDLTVGDGDQSDLLGNHIHSTLAITENFRRFYIVFRENVDTKNYWYIQMHMVLRANMRNESSSKAETTSFLF